MNRKLRITLAILVSLLCVYESITKGWYSLLLFPALVIVIPVLIIGQLLDMKSDNDEVSVTILRLLQLISAFSMYVFTVGFGDTEDVFLFGFYSTKIGTLADISSTIAAVGFIGFAISSITLFILAIVRGAKHMKRVASAEASPADKLVFDDPKSRTSGKIALVVGGVSLIFAFLPVPFVYLAGLLPYVGGLVALVGVLDQKSDRRWVLVGLGLNILAALFTTFVVVGRPGV